MAAIRGDLADLAVDIAIQPAENRRKRLLIADMDSTIINVECLDELADFAGVKDRVSEITERAMRGELAFEGALRERVGMLKGLGVDALQRCYDQRVRLNPGAEILVRTMARHGARCALVSGGFTFFNNFTEGNLNVELIIIITVAITDTVIWCRDRVQCWCWTGLIAPVP